MRKLFLALLISGCLLMSSVPARSQMGPPWYRGTGIIYGSLVFGNEVAILFDGSGSGSSEQNYWCKVGTMDMDRYGSSVLERIDGVIKMYGAPPRIYVEYFAMAPASIPSTTETAPLCGKVFVEENRD